jgi:prepilin-type N-terminal cleavage/methylation domain-containing protein
MQKKLLKNQKGDTVKHRKLQASPGFTIMEIVVATAIFAVVVSSMMALLDYTLRLNRRAEALRQSTQGMRNFVEFLVKEIRNGQIDYSVNSSHDGIEAPIGPCPSPGTLGSNTYTSASGKTNRLGVINLDGERECFYLGNASGAAVAVSTFTGQKLMLQKESLPAEDLNPQNFTVEELAFFVQPRRDPYVDDGPGYARVQPFVTMSFKFVVQLPTREKVELYYQTSVSTAKYDVPK